MRRSRATALFAVLMLVSLGAPAAVSASAPPQPTSMASTGDSITRAFNDCSFPYIDCPARSWSTGTDSTVNSHALRLGITASAANDAVSGAKMADLPGQMSTAIGQNVGYVTVLMGGNDVCTSTEAGMTSVASFQASFSQAMNVVAADTTPPLVYVVSVPDVKHLWEIFKDNSSARSTWATFNVCQALLANPLSTAQADVDRRERVKQRNMAFNEVLRAVCATYAFCRFDGEAAFGTPFATSDVTTRDYFHPAVPGQTKLATVTWDHGYWGTLGVNDPPTTAFAPACSALTCTFTDGSFDPQGVAAWSWNFGDGQTSTSQNPAHTYAAAGSYTVSLTAIDGQGATATATHVVSVANPPPPTTMHVAALTGSAGSRRGGWSATVTVTIRDTNGAPVSGATVGGSWTTGASGGCTTTVSGACSFTTNMSKKRTSATYTVASVTGPLTYDPSANVVSSVTVTRP
jgi:PKD repeat protein